LGTARHCNTTRRVYFRKSHVGRWLAAELFRMALLMRGRSDYLTDRYSERNERTPKKLSITMS
jgi:hypothetical protein